MSPRPVAPADLVRVRTSRVSRESRWPAPAWRRALSAAPARSPRAARDVSSSAGSDASRVAPLDTSDRWEALAAERQPLVEHPLHLTPGQPDKDLVHDAPVVPQVHCHDRHRLGRACGRDRPVRVRAGGPVRTAVRSANHGTASTTCGALIRSPRTSTPRTTPCSTTTRARALSRTVPPRAWMKSRAGSAYI